MEGRGIRDGRSSSEIGSLPGGSVDLCVSADGSCATEIHLKLPLQQGRDFFIEDKITWNSERLWKLIF